MGPAEAARFGKSVAPTLVLLSALLAGCAVAGPEGAHRSDCENRGYVRGTPAYDRCLRDAGGRAFLEDLDRRRSFGR